MFQMTYRPKTVSNNVELIKRQIDTIKELSTSNTGRAKKRNGNYSDIISPDGSLGDRSTNEI